MAHLWHHVIALGAQHGVNPVVFAVLYLAHHPLFWGTMAWLAASVKKKKPIRGIIALGIFFWLLPYLYVFAFGHGLPWWIYVVVSIVIAIGGGHVLREIRRRLPT